MEHANQKQRGSNRYRQQIHTYVHDDKRGPHTGLLVAHSVLTGLLLLTLNRSLIYERVSAYLWKFGWSNGSMYSRSGNVVFVSLGLARL